MVKVLCFHAFGQTGEGLKAQLKPVADQLPDFDFHYLDAPLAVPGLRDFEYLGSQKIATTGSAPAAAAPAATPDKAKSKALAGGVLAESILRAARAELESDDGRPARFGDGKWAEYLRSSASDAEKIIAQVPEVKEVLDKLEPSQDPVAALEKMAGRSSPFARTWSLQGHAYKSKGEWIGYSSSMKTIAEYIDKHGPFDGCIGFSAGGQLAWVLQVLLSRTSSQRDWPVFKPTPTRQPPFKFVLTSSAIDLVEPNSLAWLNAQLPLPDSPISLTTWDASNTVIPAVGMWSFSKRMGSNKSGVHPGKHVFYTKAEWAGFFADWLKAAAAGDRETAQKITLPKDALDLKAGFPPRKDKGDKAKL